MSGSATAAPLSLPDRSRVHNRYTHTKGTPLNNAQTTTAGGYDVPVDPMDDMQCECCQ